MKDITPRIHRKALPVLCGLFASIVATGCHDSSGGSTGNVAAVGDEPVILHHLDQTEIEAGRVPTNVLLRAGAELFSASFNTLDGAGRPETTGTGAPRARREAPQNFNRVSAPDANSCAIRRMAPDRLRTMGACPCGSSC